MTAAQAKRYAAQLQDLFLFRGFSPQQIAGLLFTPGIGVLRFQEGATLLSQQSAAPALGILLRGAAVVEKQSGQGFLRMSELGPGALYGMAALFLGGAQRSFPTRVIALRNCTALVIPEIVLRELFQREYRLAENYIRYLTERIYFLNARIDGLIQPSVPERVLLYLQQNAVGGEITHGLTQLAQALSISRAALYRALDALEASGRISRQGRHMRLLEESDPANAGYGIKSYDENGGVSNEEA